MFRINRVAFIVSSLLYISMGISSVELHAQDDDSMWKAPYFIDDDLSRNEAAIRKLSMEMTLAQRIRLYTANKVDAGMPFVLNL